MDGAEDVEQAASSCRPRSYSQVKACRIKRRGEGDRVIVCEVIFL